MLEYVWGGESNPDMNRAIGEFVAYKTWGDLNSLFPVYSTLGVFKDRTLIAGVVYHDYSPEHGTIDYSGATDDPSWLKGATLHHMFAYPFERLGCQMVITVNSANNKRLHRQLRRLDHKAHYIRRLWGRDEDAIHWTFTKEAWEANAIIARSRRYALEKEHVST
ncbi:MAG: N-acetyltransferase [Pseudomonadota bacterium]